MRSLLSLFLFFSLSALASDPIVTSISPDSGPTSGGTHVTITGDHLDAQVLCIVPCPTEVTFGDVTVTATEEHPDHLIVIAPAHAAGAVDVTVAPAGAKPLVVANGFRYVSGVEDAYERILLPVYTNEPVDGANGSRWQTDFWLRNNSAAKTVNLAPWPCGPVCPPVVPNSYTLQPETAIHNLPEGYDPAPGTVSRILYLLRNQPEVSMSLRVADISRSALNAGTEIPLIRESELLDAPADLLNVSYDPSKFRLMLRIYDPFATSAQYRVTLYGMSEGAAPLEHEVTLTTQSPQTGDFRTEAAVAQYDFSPLANVDKVWPAAFRIHIEPLVPGSRYWAFVSITNNETQLITLVTPQ
jgi:hypothetical protein